MAIGSLSISFPSTRTGVSLARGFCLNGSLKCRERTRRRNIGSRTRPGAGETLRTLQLIVSVHPEGFPVFRALPLALTLPPNRQCAAHARREFPRISRSPDRGSQSGRAAWPFARPEYDPPLQPLILFSRCDHQP